MNNERYYELPRPLCVTHDLLELSLDYDAAVADHAFAGINDIFHFQSFPSKAIKDYFYKSNSDEYTVVFFTSKGPVLFNCYHCLVVNDRAWVECEQWAHRLNYIQDIELWPTKYADWELFESNQWVPIED